MGFFFLIYNFETILLLSACLLQVTFISVFLGAFARLRKETVSFVVSVCPHGTSRHVACDMRHDIRTRRMSMCELFTDYK